MAKQTPHEQERIVEAVRLGLEGEAAVEFIQNSGYSMTSSGIAKNLRAMGGRARILEAIGAGFTNIEVLQQCLPSEDFSELHDLPPSQQDLFGEPAAEHTLPFHLPDAPLYDTTRLTLTLPADLYEAIRLAAKAEGKSQNRLIVEILTSALSRIPLELPEEEGA